MGGVSDRGRCPPSWDDGACLESIRPSSKGIYEVQACHSAVAVSATFDEPNLVSCAGLVPVLRLAERAGLHAAAQRRVGLPASAGSGAANPGAKITSIVAGMVAGADSIDDLAVIRHGALPRLFGGIRAPSTLGTFLRGFTWGSLPPVPCPSARSPVRRPCGSRWSYPGRCPRPVTGGSGRAVFDQRPHLFTGLRARPGDRAPLRLADLRQCTP